jgi:hypothetical protein
MNTGRSAEPFQTASAAIGQTHHTPAPQNTPRRPIDMTRDEFVQSLRDIRQRTLEKA